MVKFLHFKTMALLLLMIVGASSAWAETVTFTAGTDKSEGTSITKSGITISFSSGVFNRDDNYRCYSGASMTISSTVGNITQIDFTATSSNPMTKFSGNPDVGAWTDSNKTQWKGNASEINFGTTSGQARITEIVVTYTTSGGSGGDTPTKTVTTTTISATGITNTDVYTSTTAGTLSASVTAGENAVSGATVTWSSSNTSVATVDANGAVTLVAAGTATITASYAGDDTYAASSATYELTVTSSAPVVDYATLPFNWAGGSSSALKALTGVTVNADNSDYASSNSPYLVKFNGTGKYIIIKTDSRPGVVTMGVKMIGGSTSSTITVQGSADGETYRDLETLTISGNTNDEVTLTSTCEFAATDRFVKLYYTKGSNVGVGPISISQYVEVVHNPYDLTVSNLTNVNTFVFDADDQSNSLLEGEGTVQVLDGKTVMVSTDVNQNCELQSLVVDGVDVTSKIDETGAYTFTMPTHDVTISASAIEMVTNTYTLATTITSGKHYVITNVEGTKVMGAQNSNNRAAVDPYTVGLSSLSIRSNTGAAEFVIYGPDANGFYTIYDGNGYLYAAGSGSNYLRTQTVNDNNGKWSISISDDDGDAPATVVAQGTNANKYMRFNNTLFSCYGVNSSVTALVSLYEKDGEPTPTESITVSNAGYATYVSDNALDYSGLNVKAYKATVNGTNITFTKVTKVPAGEGVLLQGAGTFEVPTVTGTITGWDNNAFKRGADAAVASDAGNGLYNYILNNGSQGIGFYKANGQTVAKNRAYLQSTSNAARIAINFDDEATGIANLIANDNDNQVFDLQGRRVAQPQKGLYIVNGKKVLVK